MSANHFLLGCERCAIRKSKASIKCENKNDTKKKKNEQNTEKEKITKTKQIKKNTDNFVFVFSI